jgi:hypothetical protein
MKVQASLFSGRLAAPDRQLWPFFRHGDRRWAAALRMCRLARTESTRSTHVIDVKTKFITVEIFILEPADLPEFAREATLAMQRKAPSRPGFIEGVVMADDSQRQALIVTQWESRSHWVGAEWDEEIGLVKGCNQEFGSLSSSCVKRALRT